MSTRRGRKRVMMAFPGQRGKRKRRNDWQEDGNEYIGRRVVVQVSDKTTHESDTTR